MDEGNTHHRAKSAGFTLIENAGGGGDHRDPDRHPRSGGERRPVRRAIRRLSKNQIQQISNAVDRYYQDHLAYPGIFNNTTIAAGEQSQQPRCTHEYRKLCPVTLWRSSNHRWLAVGTAYSDATGFTYTSADAGRGPLTFNNRVQKRLPSYLDVTRDSLSIPGSDLDPPPISETARPMGANVGVPEFIDRFPNLCPLST